MNRPSPRIDWQYILGALLFVFGIATCIVTLYLQALIELGGY